MDLLVLPAALGEVHMDPGAHLLGHAADPHHQLPADKVRPLGAEEDADAPVVVVVEAVEEIQAGVQGLLA